ncbi:FadR/GntR family transcriptional regulator [uncultured Tateyamaria sp.]|uniref:FadR/GntR family transcriptional regulator n=1 Tax=uncultured Tateyamaria sp. TaxID=455651 RepID=UPI00261465FF|nr:FadR/GntR family transcriptional regulator [uncultured Tateyamaria sp.]
MPKTELLVQRIRQMIASDGYTHNDRLPPERAMCATLGVTRNQLRSALARLEARGLIWRHVGRGTFVGERPVLNLDDVLYLRDQVTPPQVASVRLAIEPELARLAATNSTPTDREELRTCAERCRDAPDWRSYEAWDNKFHFAVARGAKNQLFLYYFETLNVVRRSMVWAQPRTTAKPVKNYSSFLEHDLIVKAIDDTNGDLAAHYMKQHLRSVYGRILPSLDETAVQRTN